MNLITLQYYITVCDTGSMAKAAEQLSLSRQALSKAILTLEDQVGIKLLKRNKSGTELTPAGEILYRHACSLLQDWNAALKALEPLKREQQAHLRVGYGQMTYNIWEAGHAEAFAKAHPEICLSYKIMPPEQLLQHLAEGQLDLIISGGRGDPDTTFSVLLRQLPIFVLLSQEDPLSQKSEIHLEDLSHHSIFMNASTLFSGNIHRCFQAEGIEAEFLPFPSHDPLTLLRTIRNTRGAYFDTKLHFLYQNLLDGLVAIPFRHEGSHPFPSWNVLATTTLAQKDNPIVQQYIHYLSDHQITERQSGENEI